MCIFTYISTMYVCLYIYIYMYISMYISALHLLAHSCARCRVSTLALFHRNICQHALVQIRGILHYDVFTRPRYPQISRIHPRMSLMYSQMMPIMYSLLLPRSFSSIVHWLCILALTPWQF